MLTGGAAAGVEAFGFGSSRVGGPAFVGAGFGAGVLAGVLTGSSSSSAVGAAGGAAAVVRWARAGEARKSAGRRRWSARGRVEWKRIVPDRTCR